MTPPQPLAPGKTAMLAGYGILLWFVAAQIIAVIAPLGVFQGSARILTYLLVTLGTFPTIWLARPMFRLAPGQLFPGIAIATMAATLLDGLALAWLPALYGAPATAIGDAGAIILWGAGVGLAFALLLDRR